MRIVFRWIFAGVYALIGVLVGGGVAFLLLAGVHAATAHSTTQLEVLAAVGVAGASATALALGYLRQ